MTPRARAEAPPVVAPGEYRRPDGTVLEVFDDGSRVLHLPGGGDLILPDGVDPETVTYLDVPGPDRWAETPSSSTELGPADVPVHVAFARVMSEVGSIPKTHEHKGSGAGDRFLFRGIEDVQAALHPALVRHGSFILPEETLERRELPGRETNAGKPYNAVALRVRFRFYGPRGDSVPFEAWGEGQDRSDKATGKAHSMAAKSALLQAFMIPTGDQPDADRDDPEEQPLTPEQQAAKADALARALKATREATNPVALRAIGGEAARQGLLRMRVEVDGQSMTLEQYGSQRLADLEREAAEANDPPGPSGGSDES